MARGGNVRVRIAADTSDLERGTKRAERTVGASAKTIGKLGGALAGAFAVGEVLDFGAASIKAYQDAEVSEKKLQAQLKASGISYRAHAKEIDAVIQKTSQLSALDDEDLQDAFTNIVRVTGDVDKSLHLVGLAADFARAKHIDVAKAGEIVAKVAGGNTGILSRYGIAIDKGASSAEALAALQKRFGGQAEAYGKTTAGSIGRMNVAFENLKEKVGGALAPTLAKVADGLARFTTQMQDGTGAGGKFVDRLDAMWASAKPVVAVIASLSKQLAAFAGRHPQVARLVFEAAALGAAIRAIRWASAISGLSTFLAAAKGLGKPLVTTFSTIGTRMGTAASASTAEAMATRLPGSMNARMARFSALGTLLGRAMGVAAAYQIAHQIAMQVPALAQYSGSKGWGELWKDIKHDIAGGGSTPKVRPRVGGARRRTGGVVTTPTVIMGEEAPRHPEWVIATNPAYRARNLGLWAQAGRALGIPGFARGGVYSNAELQRLWVQQGGAPSARVLAAAIAQAESSGRAGATNRNSNGTIDRGLWQINSIHGALSTMSPTGSARAAVQISNNGRNWRPWVTYNTGAYKRYLQPAVSIDASRRAGLKLTVRRAGTRRVADGIVHAGGASTFIDGKTGSSWGSDTSTPEARERLARAELAGAGDGEDNTAALQTALDEANRLVDQANLRAAVAQRAQGLSDSFLKTMTGLGDLWSGSPIIFNVNTLHPGDPATHRAIASSAAAGFGLQGYTQSPRTWPGM